MFSEVSLGKSHFRIASIILFMLQICLCIDTLSCDTEVHKYISNNNCSRYLYYCFLLYSVLLFSSLT
jgi:hypothetical protein